MNRAQRRAAERRPQEAPPAAGAVDLNFLRGGNADRQKQMEKQLLAQNGLLCNCGNRISTGGVWTMGIILGVFPTPQGPQDGAHGVTQIFCSRTCAGYLEALKDGLQSPTPGLGRARIMVTRELPTVTWHDELGVSQGRGSE